MDMIHENRGKTNGQLDMIHENCEKPIGHDS